MKERQLYYSDYLQLDKILSSQELKSTEHGKTAHDEMLFIIVHQAYELWFKEIIHEFRSVIDMFKAETINEKSIGTAVFRLQRITEIEKLLIDQLRILETMTPLDFLDFRDYLIPASGFQSFQFRIIENLMGLKQDQRVSYNAADYFGTLSAEHQKIIKESAENKSLFDVVEKWLERTPFLKAAEFDFWQSYKDAVKKMIDKEKEIIEKNPGFSEEKRTVQLKEFENTKKNFDALFEEAKHNKLVQEGVRKFSYKSTLAVLFINLYRDEPILHMPFRFLNLLEDIDELFSTWRYRHALMVRRMIGSKVGTGGSAGHKYLLSTIEKHRIFPDLFDIATYLIPRSQLPELPENVKRELGFYYTYKPR